jgi:hypothetical protein
MFRWGRPTLPDIVGEARCATPGGNVVEDEFGHCLLVEMIAENGRMILKSSWARGEIDGMDSVMGLSAWL